MNWSLDVSQCLEAAEPKVRIAYSGQKVFFAAAERPDESAVCRRYRAQRCDVEW
jgi:hypothetical protein